MSQVPEDILNTLTNFKMPGPVIVKQPDEIIYVNGTEIPLYRCGALVLGSGAAGLRATVELKRRNVDVLTTTSHLFGGTSACSGSDKQTLHTACTNNRGDDFIKMARDISAGGCMDIDTAYVESVGSIYALSSLIYLGLPLPHDLFGAALRYKTDHDEAGRATSCGPLSSRLMTRVLCEEAIKLGAPFLTGCTGVRILTGSGQAKGLVVVMPEDKTNTYGLGLVLFDKLVLAAGGPGELYRDSVYPRGCFGALGMAIEAGAKAVNLTETQFGIGTSRDGFPWNLSGSYVQVMPYIYSVDAGGQEHNFLAGYYRTTRELASNIFRKGYQWPFHAQRLLDYGSSLIDLAIYIESSRGNRVFMDFKRNPQPAGDGKAFSMDNLDDDVRNYLANNEAMAGTPIDRLRSMNPLAIELYKSHGVDIAKEPLQFNVNNQHLNGGLEVDIWGRTSIENCYAAGENAGTHGVTRPGGSALNAGQVFGTRCAQHIAANISAKTPRSDYSEELAGMLEELACAKHGKLVMEDVRNEVQARMSEKAGFICRREEAASGLEDARKLNSAIREDGLKLDSPKNTARYFQWKQTALLSEAVLTALDHYIKNGGGSRGARLICAPDGTMIPKACGLELNDYRFKAERDREKNEILTLQYDGKEQAFKMSGRKVRTDIDLSQIFFEKNWGAYLTGDIYRKY